MNRLSLGVLDVDEKLYKIWQEGRPIPGDLPDSIVFNASKHSFSVNSPSHFCLSLSLSEGRSWSKNKVSENDVTLGFL